MACGLPPVGRYPFADRIVRLLHAVVGTAVDGDGSLAARRFRRIYLACSFKCARDLDTVIAQYRRARLRRVVVEKDVVAVRPQSWPASMNGQTLPSAGPHAEPTPPSGTSRRTAANLRG